MSVFKVDQKRLASAVEAGVLQPGQDSALLSFLQSQQQQQPSFQLAHVSYYFGAVLIMAAMGWLLNEAWSQAGETALLLLSAAYMLGLTALGLRLWKRGLEIPAGLLAAVAVSLTPLLVFSIQSLLGFWPADEHAQYPNYYIYIQASWLPMELLTIIAGLVMLRFFPFPFIVMPIALALWFFSMDVSAALYGSNLGFESRANVSVIVGLAILVFSMIIDSRLERDFAFWGYLAGLLAFWGGLTAMDSGSEWGKAIYCGINLILMFFAVLLRRPVFMVFGAFGVAIYLGYLSMQFSEMLLFPIFLSMIGLGLIFLGIAYQRHRQKLSQKLRKLLPQALINALPALQH